MVYVISGNPTPLARARMCNGKKPWDSQKQNKMAFGSQLIDQHGDLPAFEGALHLDVTFYFPFPQTVSKSKALALKGRSHTFKPDLSNLIKFIEDVATGILFSDDCLIASIAAKKCYDDVARTEFVVKVIHAE